MLTPYPLQQRAIEKQAKIIRDRNFALCTSSLGSGKTLMAIETARSLGLTPLVVAPKSTLTSWERTLDEQGVDYYDILSWEKMRRGDTKWYKKVNQKSRNGKWNLPKNTLLILDEVHKAKAGSLSQQGRMVIHAAMQNIPILAMSGTPFVNPLDMEFIAIATKQIRDSFSFRRWCKQHGCTQNWFNAWEFNPRTPGGEKGLKDIRELLYGKSPTAVQITRQDLKEFFTDSTLSEVLVDFDAKVLKKMKELEKFVLKQDQQRREDLERDEAKVREALAKGKEANVSSTLREILRVRQEIELLKTPVMSEYIQNLLDENKSVVVFVSFKETINALLETFKEVPSVVIDGSVTGKDRQRAIDQFQADEAHLAFVNFQAGGAGISLHDTRGERPRASVLNTTFSITDTLQALGRIDRAGAKSNTEQYVLVAAGTYEEEVFKSVKDKHYSMTKAVL